MKLKVFGYMGFVRDGQPRVQVRMVVATTSKKKAAELFKTTLGDMNAFGAETGNKLEVATALAKPGTVFWRPLDARGDEPPFKALL